MNFKYLFSIQKNRLLTGLVQYFFYIAFINNKKMKRILLFCVTLIFALSVKAQQPCTPGAKSVPGAKWYVIPDSATGLKRGCAGMPYDEVIYVKSFKDTTTSIPILGAIKGIVDSFIINLDPTTVGLPTFITGVTSVPMKRAASALHNFPNVKLLGDSSGCVRLTGTIPANHPTQTYLMDIPFITYSQLFLVNLGNLKYGDTVLEGSVTVRLEIDAVGTNGCFLTGIKNNDANFKLQVTPNPSQANINFNIETSIRKNITLNIIDVTGRTVYNNKLIAVEGLNVLPIDGSIFKGGIYHYTLSDGQNKITGKFVKQ